MSPSNSVEVFHRLQRQSSACTAPPAKKEPTEVSASLPQPTNLSTYQPTNLPGDLTTQRPNDLPMATTWYLLDAKRCRFDYRDEAAGPYEHTDEIQGTFRGIWLEWFPGFTPLKGTVGQKDACYCACVLLITEAGIPIIAKVSGPVPYYILAAKLRSARMDDFIQIRAEAVGNSCCFNVFIRDGEAWKLPPRTEVDGATITEKVAQGTQRFYAHPSYLLNRELAGPDGGQRQSRKQPAPSNCTAPPENLETFPRQTHAQIPHHDSPGIHLVGYDRYMEQLRMSDTQIEAFVAQCRRAKIRARQLVMECQVARCDTPGKALWYAKNRKEEAA